MKGQMSNYRKEGIRKTYLKKELKHAIEEIAIGFNDLIIRADVEPVILVSDLKNYFGIRD